MAARSLPIRARLIWQLHFTLCQVRSYFHHTNKFWHAELRYGDKFTAKTEFNFEPE
jgi:hypothetical protein